MSSELTFQIVEHIGTINKFGNGWTKELNIVSWNNSEPKYDLREWDETHTRMSRGITLRESEMKALVVAMEGRL